MFHLKRGGDFLPPHFNIMDRIDYQHRRNELLNYIHQVIAPNYLDLERIQKDLKKTTNPNEKLILNYLILEFSAYDDTNSDDEMIKEVVREFTISLDDKLPPQSLSNIVEILNNGKTDDQNREA